MFLVLFTLTILLSLSKALYTLPAVTAGGELWDIFTRSGPQGAKTFAEQWLVEPYVPYPKDKITLCNGFYWIGAPGVSSGTGYFERTYRNIPSHNFAYYSIPVRILSAWNIPDSFSIYIDGNFIERWGAGNYSASLCETLERTKAVGGKLQHTGSTLTLRIAFDVQTPNSYLLFRDVYFSFRNSAATETSASYKWDNYGCPSSSGSCTCSDTNCNLCFSNGATDCGKCKWLTSDWGSGCLSCTANCEMCSGSGANQCTLCAQTTHALLPDGSCAENCPTGTMNVASGGYNFCLQRCPTGQLMFWNYTCGAPCELPLQAGSRSCVYPCSQENAEYLYWDGRCESNCPFSKRNETWYFFCDACPQDQWSYQDMSCSPVCQQYFTQTYQGGSKFCNYPCATNEFLYQDGICRSTCTLFYTNRIEQGVFSFCDYPCATNEFLYQDGNCHTTCQPFFTQRTDQGMFNLCDYPCATNEFLYQDGICRSTCMPFYTNRIEQGVFKFCDYPCATNEFLYQDGNCQSTCQPFFTKRTDQGIFNLCDYPCLTSEFLYQDGTCHTTCKPFYMQRVEQGMFNFCDYPCQAGSRLNPDGRCSSLSNTTQEVLKGTQTASAAITQASSLLTSGSAITVSASVAGRIFFNIKFLNISYSEELQDALKEWSPSFISEGITPDIPDSIVKKIPQRNIPPMFSKYDDDITSSFLLNYYESLGMLILALLITTTFLLLKILLKFLNKTNSSFASLVSKGKVMTQNFLVVTLYGVYGDLVLYSILEYRTIQLQFDLSLLSFLLSLTLMLLMFIGLFLHLRLLKKYQHIKTQSPDALEAFTNNRPGLQVLYRDYTDKTLGRQAFLITLTVRDIFFSLLICMMFDYPLLQTTIFSANSLFMIFYLIDRKPFKSNYDVAQQVFFEFIGLAVNLSVLLNSMYENNITAVKRIGKFVIGMNMAYNFSVAGLMLLQILMLVREKWQAHKKKKSNKIVRLAAVHRRLDESATSVHNLTFDQSITVQNCDSSGQMKLMELNFENSRSVKRKKIGRISKQHIPK